MTIPRTDDDPALVHLLPAIVEGCNEMTAQWAAQIAATSVLCAPGLWVLLAALAAGASPPVKAELSSALGMPADAAAIGGPPLMQMLASDPELRAAVAAWVAQTVDLYPDWMALVGAGRIGTLIGKPAVDQLALDRWANSQTDGLIERFPLALSGYERLILASAISAKFRWRTPFEQTTRRLDTGPWAGQPVSSLVVDDLDMNCLVVSEPPGMPAITIVKVPGEGNLDVYLFLGADDAPAGPMVAAGLRALARFDAVGYTPPDHGPHHTSSLRPSRRATATVQLHTVQWEVQARHDLLAHAALFGLETAAGSGDHFPGIAPEPLMVAAAVQEAMARFDALGFEAAAVTAVGIARGAPPPPTLVRHYIVDAQRPHGFAAVLRQNALVVFAGWVGQPSPPSEASTTAH